MKIGLDIGITSNRRASAPPAQTTPAQIASVDQFGWEAEWDAATAPTIDRDGSSPYALTVTRSGHDALATPTTFDDVVLIGSRLRQPGSSTLSANKVVPSSYIYSGETLSSGVNNSALEYPYAIAAWTCPGMKIVTTDTVTLSIAVAHAYARNGKPVAGVKFIIADTDGTEAQSSVVLTPTTKTSPTTGMTYTHYEGTVDISGLKNAPSDSGGDYFICDVEFYPWIGNSHRLSVISSGEELRNNTPLYYNNNRGPNARPVYYAYVDPENGSNTIGYDGISTDPSVAAANTYASIAFAMDRMSRHYYSNTAGSFNCGGGVIRLAGSGDHPIDNISFPAKANIIPLTIEPVSERAVVTNGTAGGDGLDSVIFKNITFKGVSDEYALNSQTSSIRHGAQFENCDVQSGPFPPRLFGSTQKSFMFECEDLDGDFVIGCNCSNISNGSGIACRAVRAIGNPAAPERLQGMFIGWCKFTANKLVYRTPFIFSGDLSNRGFAYVGNVMEVYNQSSGAIFALNFDGNTNTTKNFVLQHNTTLGQRANLLYTDSGGATRYDHYAYMSGNIFEECNSKSGDFFGYQSEPTNPARIGNWGVRYGVDRKHEVVLEGESKPIGSEIDPYRPLSWLGDIRPINSIAGSGSAGTLAISFVNDQSGVSGTGGGDYRPVDTTDLPEIPPEDLPFPVDLFGTPITYAGAVQP